MVKGALCMGWQDQRGWRRQQRRRRLKLAWQRLAGDGVVPLYLGITGVVFAVTMLPGKTQALVPLCILGAALMSYGVHRIISRHWRRR